FTARKNATPVLNMKDFCCVILLPFGQLQHTNSSISESALRLLAHFVLLPQLGLYPVVVFLGLAAVFRSSRASNSFSVREADINPPERTVGFSVDRHNALPRFPTRSDNRKTLLPFLERFSSEL